MALQAFSTGFKAVDGKLGHNGNDGDCAYTWVHSRKSVGRTLVSTQELLSANTLEAEYQGDAAYTLASTSYGHSTGSFLTPDADASGAASGGESGGGDEGGGGGL